MTMPSSATQLPKLWENALCADGFQPGPGGFQKGRYAFRWDGKRLGLLDTAAAAPTAILREAFLDRGLWKWVREGTEPQRVFELPASCVQMQEPAAEAADAERLPLGALLEWAQSSASSVSPAGRTPPTIFQGLVPEAELTVQQGAWVRQGRWVTEEGRLALEFPLVLEVPADLPPSRWRWMEDLLLDAQSRWQLVRFGLGPGTGGRETVAGRVDLTGAPASPRLVLASLEALKFGTAWLVESAELLTDMGVASQVLAVLPGDPKLTLT